MPHFSSEYCEKVHNGLKVTERAHIYTHMTKKRNSVKDIGGATVLLRCVLSDEMRLNYVFRFFEHLHIFTVFCEISPTVFSHSADTAFL